jgi:hypothetical protein
MEVKPHISSSNPIDRITASEVDAVMQTDQNWAMRTTITVHPDLLARAKVRAAERNETVSDVISRALTRELSAEAPSAATPPPVATFQGPLGVQPGVDLTSNTSLIDVLDSGLALDQRR